MATLHKMTTVRYVDTEGNRVPKDAPGARKVKEKSTKWYGFWRENGKLKRVPLSTDKQAARKMLTDLLQQREREKAGLVDKSLEHLQRPIAEHVADFLAHLKTKGVCDDYYAERERCLLAVLGEAKTLIELTADAIETFVNKFKGSARTKDIYRAAVFQFCNWLVKKGRLEKNPVLHVTKPSGKPVRTRRALSVPQLQLLLDTTRVRALKEFSTIRIGPRRGQQVANLKPQVRAKLEMLGRERSLIYKCAIYTGLRRGEIAALRVEYLHLDTKPFAHLILPGEFTKNGEAARLLLIPSFAEDLRAWIKDARKLPGDLLFSVRNEMVKTMKADLEMAKIPFKDGEGRQADFHSLRMTADTMLGVAGVPPRLRMLFMRHSDIRLTMQTYDDSAMYEMEKVVKALEGLGLK